MSDDAELLHRYADHHDHAAFAELVQRHIDFVYAIALRQCHGNAARAQDATQLVFTDLARRAKVVARHPALSGWLHTATRFAAMKLIRTESRRQLREQRAAEQHVLLAGHDTPVDWTQLQPVLDDALGELKERDRAALLLRFFQGKSICEIGASLQLSETAASSCVDRALDRLRGQLARRGVTSTASALGLVLAQQVAAAAPAGLAAVVSGTALVDSAVSGAALVPIFAMKKIIITIGALALVAEFAAVTVELTAKRTLEADYGRQQSPLVASPSTASLPVAKLPAAPSVEPPTENSAASAANTAEAARLEKRLRQLRARPPGVTDALMMTPQPSGRATTLDAMKTITAAVRDHDIAALAQLVAFSDDTPGNRDAFMADIGAAARARYETPEQVAIAVMFDEVLRDPPVSQQALATHGYSGGVETVTTWTQLASGVERRDENPFRATPEGWAFPTFQLTGKNFLTGARFDPATGAVLPPKK
jgi:RNA polymerase sigma factor (sigma-70 family)